MTYHYIKSYNLYKSIIIMKIYKFICSGLLVTLLMVSIQASAGNINATAARSAANRFLKHHAANSGSLRAPALADIKLAHAEKSSKAADAYDFYAFNITGGGFIIIAGEDRARQVLGYSDKGKIDFNHLPAPLKDLLDGYKREIEFLQTYTGDDLVPIANTSLKAGSGVEPLIKTTWGQGMPYYLQCPIYQGDYCVVGCVAIAMAQVMKYWEYPISFPSIESYTSSRTDQYIPEIPATTIDYSLILNSYCHWDWDNSMLVQDVYTNEQAQEVAKLGRYCGQAVQMAYSPEASGAAYINELNAMRKFGFTDATTEGLGSFGWFSMMLYESTLKGELDAGRPILYSASDTNGEGHAFICDGYNSEGLYHFNLGWYGTCDGWYVISALNMTHRSGEYIEYKYNHEIIYKLQPVYFSLAAEHIDANHNILVLGEQLNIVAKNVTFDCSYSTFNLCFSITDESGDRVASSSMINVSKNDFVQGSDVDGAITLPTELASDTYHLQLDYNTGTNSLSAIDQAQGQLVVVGKLAKFNEAFDVSDVTTVINYILTESPSSVQLDVVDVTMLINYILSN